MVTKLTTEIHILLPLSILNKNMEDETMIQQKSKLHINQRFMGPEKLSLFLVFEHHVSKEVEK